MDRVRHVALETVRWKVLEYQTRCQRTGCCGQSSPGDAERLQTHHERRVRPGSAAGRVSRVGRTTPTRLSERSQRLPLTSPMAVTQSRVHGAQKVWQRSFTLSEFGREMRSSSQACTDLSLFSSLRPSIVRELSGGGGDRSGGNGDTRPKGEFHVNGHESHSEASSAFDGLLLQQLSSLSELSSPQPWGVGMAAHLLQVRDLTL